MTRAIATFGFVGLAPRVPGICAALAALPLAWLLHWAGGFPLLLVATAAVYAAGHAATRRAMRYGTAEPREIVVDKPPGVWVALFPLSAGLWLAGAPPHVFPWPGWTAGFVLYYLIDAWKPWPVAAARPGAVGTMLDDVVAGALAGLVVAVAGAVAHGVLM